MLAKSELLIQVAVTVQRWADECRSKNPTGGALPFEKWPHDDALVAIARTYGLSGDDLATVLDEVADELERRAMRCGYEGHWDDPDDT